MAEAKKKENFFVRAFHGTKKWFREMKSELKKVVWPTKKQVMHNVLITIGCVVVVGLLIWAFDLGSSFVVEGIISLVKG